MMNRDTNPDVPSSPIHVPVDVSDLIEPPRAMELGVPAVRDRSRRKAIIFRPFASWEDTEFCVRALNEMMRGHPPPLTYAQQIASLSPASTSNASIN
jgi:hypothetical protein